MKTMTCSILLVALVACTTPPERGEPSPPVDASSLPEVDSFQERLRQQLDQLGPGTETRRDRYDTGATLEDLRTATDREREIRAELRRLDDGHSPFPGELLAELRRVEDARYQAAWRLLIEAPTSEVPVELLALGGAR